MRIEKKPCGVVVSITKMLAEVPTRTLFRYGSHTCGPYLRTTTGYLDLANGCHSAMIGNTTLSDYKPLLDAVLYTGEEK